jgi:hypothetical protein
MEFGEDINIIIQELTDNSVITGWKDEKKKNKARYETFYN